MKRKDKGHDETPAIIADHAFIPRGAWWSLCKECGLAMASHAETTIDPKDHLAPRVTVEYMSDDEDD